MNIKRLLMILFLLIFPLTIISCGDEEEVVEKYTITWVNEDGTILETDEDVEKGVVPTYDGETPVKESIDGKTFVFSGWTPEVVAAINDAIYTATFTESNDKYTVTWKNYDGTILETDANIDYGTMPTYDGLTPAKVSTSEFTYEFSGWDKTITSVTDDITYTATFTEIINKYTITWVNEDGTILETDTDVPYGAMPEYDGTVPTKQATEHFTYNFKDWDKEIVAVTGDITYTARFQATYVGDEAVGVNPVFSQDGKTVLYGLYPQTHVNDSDLITILEGLSPLANGYYLYNGEFYLKHTAKVFNNESYKFDDGTAIVAGTEYWFKCEPIEWQILKETSGEYLLVSTKLLDVYNYYNSYSTRTISGQTVYANNYEHSDIRLYFNQFIELAFELNSSYLVSKTIDNSANTTNVMNNQYACNDTTDKVFLLSYQDYLNADYGFDTNASNKSTTREAKTTDFARANGAWCNIKTDLGNGSLYNGTYWTRSASSEFYYSAWAVNSGGYLSQYAVDGNSHCIRPSIVITISE